MLKASAQSGSPFAAWSTIKGRPHRVVPMRVAEVSFGEWTRTGHIRHAVFRGLRTDKDAKCIVRERAVRMPKSRTQTGANFAGRAHERHALPKRLQVTKPDRVMDTSTGMTKIDLLRYYSLVSTLMMKHLPDRPVSLLHAPAGVAGPLFIQKHAQTEKIEGIRQLDPALDVGHQPLIEIASKRGLLSAAQWNVIELHTMNTGTLSIAQPDRMVVDLDPGQGVVWAKVQEAAQLMRWQDLHRLPAQWIGRHHRVRLVGPRAAGHGHFGAGGLG